MELAKQLINRSDWVILDTETTGLDDEAQIVQIGLLSPLGNVLLDTLVKPTAPIPAAATRIHGITNEMVASAPGFADIYPKLVELTKDKEVIVYNADYDFRMVRQSIASAYNLNFCDETLDDLLLAVGNNWKCIMKHYAMFWGEWDDYHGNYRWQRLTNACYQQNIRVEDAHSAIGDCKMTLALIRKLGRE